MSICANTYQPPYSPLEAARAFLYVGQTTMLGISHISVQLSSGRANVNIDDITGRQED